MMSSASSTAARWPGTTRSSTAREPCSYCLAGNGRATPERWSRCWKAWTASWLCGTAERSSPARRRHPTQAFCEASTALPHTGHSDIVVSTVWAGAGRRLWQRLTQGWTPADGDNSGLDRVRKASAMSTRKPTPLQTARWNAVQKAKRRGLSIRGVARELGIHRDTAKKYMEAVSPPKARARLPAGSTPSGTVAS